ncbi:MAG: hypothetical protein ACREI9_11455 [Nitrospiraceae bacterium]
MGAIEDPKFRMTYGSQLPGGEEEIGWAWFDTKQYVSGTTNQLSFFDTVNSDKTRGNMELAGTFAAPKYFVTYAVRILPLVIPTVQTTATQTTAIINIWRDIFRLMFLSRFLLTIGSKLYLDMPSHMFPAGSGISGFSAQSIFGVTTAQKDANMYANHGTPDPKSVYTLARPRLIESQINFVVNLMWNAPVTLDGGNTDIQVMLDGVLYRPIQ